ncbi:MAG: EF-P beta-lysylation protein EpmB [Planctomycetaceae bacterium]
MRHGDPHDPLLLQVLPAGAELATQTGFVDDPVGDAAAKRAPGLLHKYHGRALLIAARECAVHCRYCFRRHHPYESEPVRQADWDPAFAVIAADESLDEVILSGGDPLLLSDRRLRQLIDRLASITHLRRLRLHTRLPIVLPDRVTDTLLNLLRSTRLTPVMVVHANHPAEIADDCSTSLDALRRAGITLLNQTVLLRGINDHADTLAELSTRLVNHGVMPYYLHQLDRVAGAAHFEVSVDEGRALVSELRRRLPGYAVPRYVAEIAGEMSKRVID